MFENETDSVEAFKKGLSNQYISFYEDGFYELIDTTRGFAGEDKQHWSDPICITQEKEDARIILYGLNLIKWSE
jgi:hypothetical protein